MLIFFFVGQTEKEGKRGWKDFKTKAKILILRSLEKKKEERREEERRKQENATIYTLAVFCFWLTNKQ